MSQVLRITTLLVATSIILQQAPTPILAAVSISGDTTISFEVQAGYNSLGTLRIDGGSTLSSGGLRLGVQQMGVGFATVTGPGSQLILTSSSTTEVGGSGFGRLEILDGGLLNLTPTFGQLRIGYNNGSFGTLIVDGQGSLLNLNNDMTVGLSGSALLRISNDAIVNAFSSQTRIGPLGRLELNDGLLRSDDFTNNGVIIGSGEISADFISGSGRFQVDSGGLLRFTGSSFSTFQNSGIIAAEGGEIEFNRAIQNSTNGPNAAEITLRNGTMRVTGSGGPQLTNSAVLAAIGGVSDFYGRISNTTMGSIAVTNKSVMIFHDDVDADDGVITVFPGSSAVFLEDLTMTGSSVLLADLAGSGADSGFGEIEVVGNATLNSSLNVTLASGFIPEEGDSFPIVAASSITGALSLGAVADLPSGLKWDLDHEASRVVLSVVPGLGGDYNSDGVVDSADYVVWRKMFGQQGDDLPADGNSNGEVDNGDYDFWLKRLGDSLSTGGGGAADGAAVPEPCGVMLILASLALVSCNRWKLN